MTTQTYQESPISLNNAAKKYQIPQTTLSNWAKIGRIKVLQRPERKGQPLLVDEASVILAREAYTPYWKTNEPRQFPMREVFQSQESLAEVHKTRDLVDKFLTSKRMAPETIRWYNFILYPFAEKYPDYPLDPEPYRQYMVSLPDKLSPQRQFNIWRGLKTFCKWCNREHELPDYFSASSRKRVEAPAAMRSRSRLPRTLTDDELVKLFYAADNFLDKTLIKTFIYAGIRSGELRSIRKQDLFNDHIKVTGKTGERQVPINQELYNDLILLAADFPQGEPIFRDRDGKPMGIYGVYQRVEKCMRRAGIEGKKLGPHTLRHTYGKIMQRESGDLVALQKLLGHTQISTTRIYAELSDQEVANKYEKYGPQRLFENNGKDKEPENRQEAAAVPGPG